MSQDTHAHYFLLLCLAASFAVVYFILQPFLAPLILAAVFAFLFQPVYQWLTHFFRGRESVAAVGTTLITVALVLLPLAFLGTQIFKESSGLYQTLAEGGENNAAVLVESLLDRARTVVPIPENFTLNINQYSQQGLQFLASNLGVVFSGLAKLLLSAFVFLMAFYFLLKDGRRLKEYVVAVSPLKDTDDARIVSRLETAVSASIKGSLTVGLIQGVLAGIGFALFGVPNAALWGSVAAVAALVPAIGTSLVLVPAVVFLFLSAGAASGVGLLLWGITAVGLVDNLLGPKLVGRGMRLHPLAVFLSVLGGLSLFGPLGFLLGPLALSVCLALIDIYFSLKEEKMKHV